jgi:hypothetical protein
LLRFIFIKTVKLVVHCSFSNNFRLDATDEKYTPGRLINHALENDPLNNLKPQATLLEKEPILVLTAKREIPAGTEVFFDYGDRSEEAVKNFQFLDRKQKISTLNSHPAVAYYMKHIYIFFLHHITIISCKYFDFFKYVLIVYSSIFLKYSYTFGTIRCQNQLITFFGFLCIPYTLHNCLLTSAKLTSYISTCFCV